MLALLREGDTSSCSHRRPLILCYLWRAAEVRGSLKLIIRLQLLDRYWPWYYCVQQCTVACIVVAWRPEHSNPWGVPFISSVLFCTFQTHVSSPHVCGTSFYILSWDWYHVTRIPGVCHLFLQFSFVLFRCASLPLVFVGLPFTFCLVIDITSLRGVAIIASITSRLDAVIIRIWSFSRSKWLPLFLESPPRYSKYTW